jgi:hypothetical protein
MRKIVLLVGLLACTGTESKRQAKAPEQALTSVKKEPPKRTSVPLAEKETNKSAAEQGEKDDAENVGEKNGEPVKITHCFAIGHRPPKNYWGCALDANACGELRAKKKEHDDARYRVRSRCLATNEAHCLVTDKGTFCAPHQAACEKVRRDREQLIMGRIRIKCTPATAASIAASVSSF